MAGGLSLQTRRELLEHMAPHYREALPAKKRVLLDEFTHMTGYHRTYAQWLLNHCEEVLQTVARRPRPPHYGPEVLDTLVRDGRVLQGETFPLSTLTWRSAIRVPDRNACSRFSRQ